ncbi:MAG: hypothetical protein Q7J35_18340 [Candidatus Methanoperedens sp.]|nr:hypothetical protein [Candidatus Methanoperedens sp.]
MPGASNSKEKMVNAGVGFIDTVNLERGEKRTVVHFLPEQPLTKGKTIMVFPARGRELPVELTGHTKVGERDPGFVLYNKDEPVGSAWVHQGQRTKFLVVKVNKDVVIGEGQTDKRMTLFPKFPKDSQMVPGV